ncbi:restriction endonuclease subunit S [Glaesserella parasuis]|uniref:restriction endonuclease subunit S n=1 Tax=Glaesserella parasuis TaxID=738 RepID=UPI00136F53D7|nr:restriction endonuclease subunit S [Glaesserella parasuis]MXO46060.1 restriction endonuclease subunit S [Glaesserella parasuis]
MSKLGDFVRVQGGYAFKSSELSDDKTGVPVIKIGNITGGSFVDLSNYQSVSFQLFEKTKSFATKDNDILIAMTGANVGKTSRVPVNSDAYLINQRVGRFLLKEDCPYTSDFIYYVVSSKQAYQYFSRVADGAAQPNISGKTIEDLEFPNIDSRCANKIGNILKSLDDKTQLNTQINQTLEQIAQTIFKSWFIDFDPVHAKANALASGQTLEQATQAAMAVISGKNTQELHRLQTANPEQYQQLWEIAEAFPSGFDEEGVPWGWESKKVGEVAKIVKGKKPKLISSEPDDGFLPHILMASLSGKYTEYAQIDKSIVCDIFDTLILMDGAASGKIAIGHKGVIGSTFAKMELSENKYWALFNLFMFSKEQDIQANTTGTSIPHTDKARVLDYEIIVPCDVVLNYFTEMYKNILCSILNQRKNSFILENIRDLLLPKLLSGEILNGN